MDIKRLINEEDVSDHTALLPTKSRASIDFENLNLSENEKKILELVYRNLEEATSKPYKYEKTSVTISYAGELFTATGVRNIELGWKKNRPDEAKEYPLPECQIGDKINVESIFVETQQTQPPERYTDGELLQAMENAGKDASDNNHSGIGTPATRTETIEKLVSGGYIERKGKVGQAKVLVPTKLVRFLYNVLPESLKSAKLTAEWETKLSEVGKGTLSSEEFMGQIKDFVQKILKDG